MQAIGTVFAQIQVGPDGPQPGARRKEWWFRSLLSKGSRHHANKPTGRASTPGKAGLGYLAASVRLVLIAGAKDVRGLAGRRHRSNLGEVRGSNRVPAAIEREFGDVAFHAPVLATSRSPVTRQMNGHPRHRLRNPDTSSETPTDRRSACPPFPPSVAVRANEQLRGRRRQAGHRLLQERPVDGLTLVAAGRGAGGDPVRPPKAF
jgi:hypothetical protein